MHDTTTANDPESPPLPDPPAPDFASLDDVTTSLEQTLAASTADETEVVWLQQRCGHVATDGTRALGPPRLSVLIRVMVGRRPGWYRTDTARPSELEHGVRMAMAVAAHQTALTSRRVLPINEADNEVQLRRSVLLRDETIESWSADDAAEALTGWCPSGTAAALRWQAHRLAVFNSHGLRRSAAATTVSLDVEAGSGSGASFAGASARSLTQLDPTSVVARAQALTSDAPSGTVPDASVPVLLAPEATIVLLDLLNAHAFTGRGYLRGTSFLTRHRNIQVFDRAFALRDDATSADGLPYPFDLEGAAKRPLDLVIDGKPLTPALDRGQGLLAELPATSQAIGGGDAMFGNLFLQPGEADDAALLEATDDGVRIGWIERARCLDPNKLLVRARARGVRRIRRGRLAEPLPDLVWEASLLRAWAQLRGLGREVVVRSVPTTPFGAISAPSMVLAASDALDALG